MNDDNKQIVVIGAGSTGASTVYHLARSGQKVLAIDKGQVASGNLFFRPPKMFGHYPQNHVYHRGRRREIASL